MRDFVPVGSGVEIAIHRNTVERPRGVCIAWPGMFSDARFFTGTRGLGLAHYLAEAGYTTWSVDPRGHGSSSARALGWRFEDWVEKDIPAVVAAARQEFPTTPIVLVGHSAGGAAVLASVGRRPDLPVAGLVVAGTPFPEVRGVRRALTYVCSALSRRRDVFPSRKLRLGPEDEVSGVLEQWMTWNLRGNWVSRAGADYLDTLPGLNRPILFVASQGDTLWAPQASCLRLARRVGSQHKSFLLCGKAFGMKKDYNHVEMLASRAARGDTWPALVEWLLQVVVVE